MFPYFSPMATAPGAPCPASAAAPAAAAGGSARGATEGLRGPGALWRLGEKVQENMGNIDMMVK